ncbi:MAG: hypothetical protein KGL39_16055 [Patescibacteria group bacterium]|nr:hypothetical protein [Patescibacteria group bacterium]
MSTVVFLVLALIVLGGIGAFVTMSVSRIASRIRHGERVPMTDIVVVCGILLVAMSVVSGLINILAELPLLLTAAFGAHLLWKHAPKWRATIAIAGGSILLLIVLGPMLSRIFPEASVALAQRYVSADQGLAHVIRYGFRPPWSGLQTLTVKAVYWPAALAGAGLAIWGGLKKKPYLTRMGVGIFLGSLLLVGGYALIKSPPNIAVAQSQSYQQPTSAFTVPITLPPNGRLTQWIDPFDPLNNGASLTRWGVTIDSTSPARTYIHYANGVSFPLSPNRNGIGGESFAFSGPAGVVVTITFTPPN